MEHSAPARPRQTGPPEAAGDRGHGRPPGAGQLPLLCVDRVSKQYGGVRALADVSLDIAAGQVHALVGANGAGKSTLVRILAGVEAPDSGRIVIDGAERVISSPWGATELGLGFIHQELNLVPQFSVLQNLAMNYDAASRYGLISWKNVRPRAQAVLADLGANFPLDREARQLTVSQRWIVAVGRSLMRDARVVAMDEPTASFAAEEAERVFAIVRELTARGVAVLYISHRLDEVLDLSTTISVLRNGRLVASLQAADADRNSLTEAIVGRAVARAARHHAARETADEVVLQVEELVREPRVKGATLDLHRGEILGLAGLVGAGRTELARLIFGAEKAVSGKMTLHGRPFAPRSPYEAIARGVALVPEERRSQALLLRESLAVNINLATIGRNRWRAHLPLLSSRKERAAAAEMASRFAIKAASVAQPVSALSGGNQQKAVVSRYVRTGASVLILDEPTIGVDVGARAELYAIFRSLADAGTSVLMISSDFEEFAICDRVAVMREGRITAVIDGALATKETLTELCYEIGQDSDD
jgi:ribose transport system ATP-binding protein